MVVKGARQRSAATWFAVRPCFIDSSHFHLGREMVAAMCSSDISPRDCDWHCNVRLGTAKWLCVEGLFRWFTMDSTST